MDTYNVSFTVDTTFGTKKFCQTLNAKNEEDAFEKALIAAANTFSGGDITQLGNISDKEIQQNDNLENNEKFDNISFLKRTILNEIDIQDVPYTIFEYIRQITKGRVILNPDFQRNLVWKNSQKSKFIESILLNYPIQPFYLNETKDSKLIVIDGLQRSSTLQSFLKNELILSDLEILPKYNGMTYEQLPDILQTRIEDKKLTIFQLKPSTPLSVVYDLFYRINTGGTQLNKQEIRNCIYIGESTKLLKSLSEEEFFKKAIDWGVSAKRMKDREMILRYISFRWFDYKSNYTGDLSNYLESSMNEINSFSTDKINDIKEDFKIVMETAFNLWGRNCFRIPTFSTRGTINTSIFESVSFFISRHSSEHLLRNKDVLIENYERLVRNEEYLNAVVSATSSKNKVFRRFELANDILGMRI